MADTNVNYQNYSGNIPTGNFGYGGLVGLDNSMGLSAGNQPTFIQNGNIYAVKDGGNGQYSVQQIDTVANRQGEQAQQAYAAEAGSAVAGLQGQEGSLGQQYADLLANVKGIYTPQINAVTQTAGEALAKRGLTPDSQLYQQQVQGALQPVYGAEAQNAQGINLGSISDTNTYNMAIANAKLGIAGTNATLPLNYGSLQIAQSLLPSQIAEQSAQGSYYGGINPNALSIAQLQYGEPFSVQSGVIFNPTTGKFNQAGGGAVGGGAESSSMSLARKVVGMNTKRPQASSIGNFVTSS